MQHVVQDHLTGGLRTQAADLTGCSAGTKRAAMNRIKDGELNQPQGITSIHGPSLKPPTQSAFGQRVVLPRMSTSDTPEASGPRVTLPHGDPVAVELTSAIHAGDLDALRRILAERPELACAHMIGRHGLGGGWRTPLHAAADWPGYFPAAPAAVALLLEAGADPNDDTGGDCPETPLHWAASSDDVDVAVVLIDNGADLETPGGSIGTQLDNAIGYACWHVARLLVDRGARVDKLWHAAALGMLQRIEQLLQERPAGADEVSQAFWHACAGGQRRAADYLLAKGADLDWVPEYADGTPLDAANSLGTRRSNVVGWLRERGATSAKLQD
jgi:hypothetical protein